MKALSPHMFAGLEWPKQSVPWRNLRCDLVIHASGSQSTPNPLEDIIIHFTSHISITRAFRIQTSYYGVDSRCLETRARSLKVFW